MFWPHHIYTDSAIVLISDLLPGSYLLKMVNKNEICPAICPFLFKWIISTAMKMARLCKQQALLCLGCLNESAGMTASNSNGDTGLKSRLLPNCATLCPLILLHFCLNFFFNIQHQLLSALLLEMLFLCPFMSQTMKPFDPDFLSYVFSNIPEILHQQSVLG